MKWVGSLIVLLFLWGCEGQQPLVVGKAPDEPASAIAETLIRDFGDRLPLALKTYADQNQLTVDLQAGRVDLGIIEQPLRPLDNLRLITPLYRSVLHVLIRDSLHDCKTPVVLTDVVGLGKVYAGPPGSAGHSMLTALAQGGWLPRLKELDILETPFGDAPDIFIQFGGILSQDAQSRLPGFCLASLGDVARLGNGSWAEGVSYRFPHLSPFVLPAGIYPALNPEPVLSLAVTHLLVTHGDMEADLIYDVMSLVKENANDIGAIDPMVGATIHEEFINDRLNIPLHEGTQRYMQRNAPSFLERYAELLAFLITLLVAVTSGGVAVVRIRKQAKKDRIDSYMKKLIDVRQDLAARREDTSVLRSRVLDLQASVTQLVVDERLIADSTFLAFLTLSNQILNELNHP